MAELNAGERFGRLVVLKRNRYYGMNGRKKDYHQFYDVQCDCGNVVTVRKYHLTSGCTRSCGCLLEEYNSKKKNAAIQNISRQKPS